MWISVSEILHFLEYPILFLAEDSQTSNFSVNFIVSLFESVQSVLALSNHLLKLIKFISHINEDIGRFRLYELRLFQLFADVFQHSGVLHQLFFKPLYEPCLINLSHLQLMLKSSSILIQLVQQNLSLKDNQSKKYFRSLRIANSSSQRSPIDTQWHFRHNQRMTTFLPFPIPSDRNTLFYSVQLSANAQNSSTTREVLCLLISTDSTRNGVWSAA
mmetsp:Transcript_9392/g.40741  ORF Transcript_9392/g.40741 Transcript_9392/m.40741 type:complete len:216 (-) Transcript_9392:1006-1653(-)